jgi:hypothetical protein
MNDYVSLPIDFVTYVVKQWSDGAITAESALSVLLAGQDKIREEEDAN